ncbi:MAG: LacI family DNA-binding transcriptional regulator [Verrucomicrobia bacterium]|nr:LacI family DNA-binding transcriptional regulator [Verrucomicrobiota bacterium]
MARSPATKLGLSRVLQHPDRVHPETRDRILKTMANVGYVRNRVAEAHCRAKQPRRSIPPKALTGLTHTARAPAPAERRVPVIELWESADEPIAKAPVSRGAETNVAVPFDDT